MRIAGTRFSWSEKESTNKKCKIWNDLVGVDWNLIYQGALVVVRINQLVAEIDPNETG